MILVGKKVQLPEIRAGQRSSARLKTGGQNKGAPCDLKKKATNPPFKGKNKMLFWVKHPCEIKIHG